MPKGVRKTVDQFVQEAVSFLSKRSPDAQEIILSVIAKEVGQAQALSAPAKKKGTRKKLAEVGETEPKAKAPAKKGPRKTRKTRQAPVEDEGEENAVEDDE
jgi:hypothetical protein